jgi:hypothetical protein
MEQSGTQDSNALGNGCSHRRCPFSLKLNLFSSPAHSTCSRGRHFPAHLSSS